MCSRAQALYYLNRNPTYRLVAGVCLVDGMISSGFGDIAFQYLANDFASEFNKTVFTYAYATFALTAVFVKLVVLPVRW